MLIESSCFINRQANGPHKSVGTIGNGTHTNQYGANMGSVSKPYQTKALIQYTRTCTCMYDFPKGFHMNRYMHHTIVIKCLLFCHFFNKKSTVLASCSKWLHNNHLKICVWMVYSVWKVIYTFVIDHLLENWYLH